MRFVPFALGGSSTRGARPDQAGAANGGRRSDLARRSPPRSTDAEVTGWTSDSDRQRIFHPDTSHLGGVDRLACLLGCSMQHGHLYYRGALHRRIRRAAKDEKINLLL